MRNDRQSKVEIAFAIIVFIAFVLVLMWGFHLDATYTTKATVFSTTKDTVSFLEERTGQVFSCYADNTEALEKGDKYIIKFDHNGTETNRFDDRLIDFGRHQFLWFLF